MTPLFRLAAVLFSAATEFDAQARPVEMAPAGGGAIDALWLGGHGASVTADAPAPTWVLEDGAPAVQPVMTASWTHAHTPGISHAAYKATPHTLRTQAIVPPVPEPPQYELLLLGLALLLLGGWRHIDASPWDVVRVGQA